MIDIINRKLLWCFILRGSKDLKELAWDAMIITGSSPITMFDFSFTEEKYSIVYTLDCLHEVISSIGDDRLDLIC